MNIIDIAILAILFISIAYGVYKGFMHALLSLGCGLLAFILALVFSPALARNLSNNPSISSTLATYTDSFARVENYDLKNLPVDQLNEGSIDQILLDHVNLPPIIENALKDNLLSGALQNKGIYSVNDYVSNTIVSIALSILSFPFSGENQLRALANKSPGHERNISIQTPSVSILACLAGLSRLLQLRIRLFTASQL